MPGILTNTIADKNQLAADNVVLSSGSNEALQAAFVAWGKKGRVVMPGLTYTDHVGYSRRMGVELDLVPLKKDMSIDLDRIADAVDDSISLVYICNPNNPTGMTLDGDELRDFCRTVGKKAVVIVDEAYNDGMAGMRVGYGLARPDLASTIKNHLMAWSNVVGLAAANGIEPLPSQTNFVYADISRNASEFQKQMAARNVLNPNYSRISMGRIEDIRVFQQVFSDVYRG